MNSSHARSGALAAMLMVVLGILFWSAVMETTDERGRKSSVISRLLRRLDRRPIPTVSSESRRRASARKEVAGAAAASSAVDVTLSCSLTGRITDEDKVPLKDAKITVRSLVGTFNQTYTSNDKGEFEGGSIPPGTYDLLAAHPQYVTLIRPNYTLKVQQVSAHVDFRLPLGATLKGKIVDEEDKPIERVRIGAHRRKREQLADGSTYMDNATYKTDASNKAGEFTIPGMSVGENIFEFKKPGYDLEIKTVKIEAAKAAEPLKIVLKKSGELAGLVVDEENTPIGTTTVFLSRYKPIGAPAEALPKEKFTVTTDAFGKFKFKKLFTEGFYDLRIDSDQFAPGIFPLVTVGSEHLVCKLERGGIIEGHAQFIDRPTTPAAVLVSAETVIKGTTFTRELQADGAGAFRFQNLPFGSYKLYVNMSDMVNEPKDGVPCTKDKPTRDVMLDIYEASRARGSVVDAENDAPVAGATISVTSTYGQGQARSKTFSLKSDSHGQFDFYRLPAGLHSVQASATGYLKSGKGGSVQRFTLEPGQKKTDVALRLDHGGVVDGFVMSPQGRPMPDCEVQLYPAVGNPAIAANWKAKTDGQGYFKIWGIEIGDRLQLFASARRQGYAKARGPLIELTTPKPNVTTQITLNNGATVSGKVTDLNELPVPGAEIKFSSLAFPNDPSSSLIQVHTQPDGSYVLRNCAAGGAAITVSRSGYVQESKSIAVVEAAPKSDVNFKLQGGVRISGTVTDLEGRPVPGAKVAAAPIEGAKGTDSAITDRDGKYTLTNLGAGHFNLNATFKIKTADGEQNYTFLLPRVPAGVNSADFDCDVANSITGFVEGEESRGLNTFTIALHSRADTKPAQDFTFKVDRPFSTARGLFRVLNTPRGVYSLSVSSEGYEPYTTNDLYVGPRQHTNIPKIKMKAAGGVIGTVISSSTDRPVNDVTVTLVDTSVAAGDARTRTFSAKTDYAGQFRVSSVPAGHYVVEASHPNYVSQRIDGVGVLTKRATDLGELFMEAGGTIYGSVQDEFGTPVTGVAIKASGATPAKQTVTDAAGNYVLQGVKQGNWPIVAQGTLNARKVYAFRTVGVQPDESETADFKLETNADLDGIVNVADGVVRSGNVRIHAFDEHANVLEDVYYESPLQAQKFGIHQVPPGQYFLWAAGMSAVTPYSLWQNLFLSRGKNALSLLISAGAVKGKVATPKGVAVPGVALQLLPITSSFRLPQALYNSIVRTTASNSNGDYVFQHLQPGAYQLLYQSPIGAYAGQWIALLPVSLGQGQLFDGLNIPVGQ